MSQTDAAPCFNASLIFPDVDAATLAREDIGVHLLGTTTMAPDAWRDYLRRVLPPLQRRPHLRILRGGAL